MPKKIHTSIPPHYPVCLHENCPMAQRCLRRNAFTTLVGSEEYMCIINPNKCKQGEKCRYFRDNTPVVYAKGFKNMQKKMTQEQYSNFLSLLQTRFGRNPYFDRRNGKTLLTPEDQSVIIEALHMVGIEEKYKFDSYIESMDWDKWPVLIVEGLQYS